ncbi:MAG: RdgB/HAM1 family non-canonical purine NTP pyrophosphatase [Rhodospirillaceae bacterium]
MDSIRKFQCQSLVIASHNEGKIIEIRDLFTNLVGEILSAKELGLVEPEETGKTFKENAELKALLASRAANLPAIADDSGLEVYALNGDPGIFSARWAGSPRDFNRAMEKVEKELAGSTDRRAAFVCALSLSWPDGHIETFEGRIEGEICWPPRGSKGFGYDPIFLASGMNQTFAEIEPQEKHAISHRAEAFRKMLSGCFSGNG